jgi:hypothetical protein
MIIYNKIRLLIFFYILYYAHLAIAQSCHKYSDADDCVSNGSSFGSIVGILLTLAIAIIIIAVLYKNSDEYKNEQKEDYWKRYDNEIKDALKNSDENSKSNTSASHIQLDKKIYEITVIKKTVDRKKISRVQKSKIIQCPQCSQRLKINVEANTQLDITCPYCKYNWIGEFIVNN